MKQIYKQLGKVRPTVEGDWSIDKTYTLLSIVYDEVGNASYISRKDVPASIQITNKEYWTRFSNTRVNSDSIVLLSKIQDDGLINSYDLQEAIDSFKIEDRRLGTFISFYEKPIGESTDYRWNLYQFNSNNIDDWNNIKYWQSIYYIQNKFLGLFSSEESLKRTRPFPIIGDYAFVGVTLKEAMVYRCNNIGVWTKTNEKAKDYLSINLKGDITISEEGNWVIDGVDTGISSKGEDGKTPLLRIKDYKWQVSYDGGIIYKDIPNSPIFVKEDDEDIVGDLQTDGVKLLKFADKEYNVDKFSGLGRVYLRKNIVNGKNVLTQEMINKPNTIYIIQYDYDLDNKEINVLENCTLQFEGGSFNNGVLNCNSAYIKSNIYNILNNTVFVGTLKSHLNLGWFKIKNDCVLSAKNTKTSIYINSNIELDSPLILYSNITLYGDNIHYLTLDKNYTKEIKTIIQLDEKSACSNITIKDFIIKNSVYGIYRNGQSGWLNNFNIKNIIFDKIDSAIYINNTGCGYCNITNCDFHNNFTLDANFSKDYIYISGGYVNLINIYNNQFADIENCNRLIVFKSSGQLNSNTISKCLIEVITVKSNKLIEFISDTAEEEAIQNTYITNNWIERIKGINNYLNCIIFNINVPTYSIRSFKIISNQFSSYTEKILKIENSKVIQTLIIKNNAVLNNSYIEANTYISFADITENTNKINIIYTNDKNKLINTRYYSQSPNVIKLTEGLPTTGYYLNGCIIYDKISKKCGIYIGDKSDKLFDFNGYKVRDKRGYSNEIPTDVNKEDIGCYFYNKTTKQRIYWDGEMWRNSLGISVDFKTYGNFDVKPVNPPIGYSYFCTDKQTTEGATNGIMIYHKGDNVWVDSLGRIINDNYPQLKKGTTVQRPTGIQIGFTYKDTDLNKWIIWNGEAWENIDGTALG